MLHSIELSSVGRAINAIVLRMVIISMIITIALSTVGIVIANKSSGKMRAIADELGLLSQGELNLHIDEKSIDRNDEIGLLADGAQTQIGRAHV